MFRRWPGSTLGQSRRFCRSSRRLPCGTEVFGKWNGVRDDFWNFGEFPKLSKLYTSFSKVFRSLEIENLLEADGSFESGWNLPFELNRVLLGVRLVSDRILWRRDLFNSFEPNQFNWLCDWFKSPRTAMTYVLVITLKLLRLVGQIPGSNVLAVRISAHQQEALEFLFGLRIGNRDLDVVAALLRLDLVRRRCWLTLPVFVLWFERLAGHARRAGLVGRCADRQKGDAEQYAESDHFEKASCFLHKRKEKRRIEFKRTRRTKRTGRTGKRTENFAATFATSSNRLPKLCGG